MKKLLLAALLSSVCLTAFSQTVHATNRVSLYSDAALSECILSDSSPRMATIYLAETSYEATCLGRFRVAASSGFTGVWLADASPFPKIGTSQTDLSVCFEACMVGQFLVVSITYQLFGTSTCSDLSIEAAPGFSEPICSTCSFHIVPCSGYDPVHVNCQGPFNCDPVATEATTWGQVKALYRH